MYPERAASNQSLRRGRLTPPVNARPVIPRIGIKQKGDIVTEFNIHIESYRDVPNEKLEEIIQRHSPEVTGRPCPYTKALAEKHRRLKIKEETEAKRHQEIQNKLEELKKPHWTVLPIFWLAFVSASAALIGIFLTLNSRPQTIVSSSHGPEKTSLIQPPKNTEFQGTTLQPISSSGVARKQGH
jgi:hypothetical protein